MNKGIPVYGKRRVAVLLLAIVMIASVAVFPTLAYLMDMTSTMVNTFVSGLDPEGDLIIRKNVTHPFGDHYVIPDNIYFDFQVSLGDAYANQVIKTTEGDIKADENGVIVVSVKANRSVGICEILAGTNVTVTEIAEVPGFFVADGIRTRSVKIPARDDAIVTFVNAYYPDPVDSSTMNIHGFKTLEGRDWQQGDAFTFKLDYRDSSSEDAQWIELGTDTVTYEPGSEDFNYFNLNDAFAKADLDRIGTYYFRVSEIEGSIGGITYDNLIRYFDVTVTDLDMNGILEINKVVGYTGAIVSNTPSFDVTVDFCNKYAPTGSAETIISIFKQMETTSGLMVPAEGYTFGIFDLDGNQIAISDPTPAAAETNVKLVFEASQAGQTFQFVLKEIGAGEQINGVIYDATEIPVTVTVIDNFDGTIRVESNITQATFKNVYDPADAIVQIVGNKDLSGRDLLDGEFKFDLYATQENFELPEGTEPIMSAVNAADGKIAFNEIVLDKLGTYYYLISEDNTNPAKGVTYDETVYAVVIDVTDDGKGQLSATVKYSVVNGEQTESIQFHNQYVEPQDPTKPSEPDTPPTGDQGYENVYILIIASICLGAVVVIRKRRERV